MDHAPPEEEIPENLKKKKTMRHINDDNCEHDHGEV